MPRKLRIAMSVFFGLLAVALCVLWVRSLWRTDQFFFQAWDRQIGSYCGVVTYGEIDEIAETLIDEGQWHASFSESELRQFGLWLPFWESLTCFRCVNGFLMAPHWFLASLCGTAAALLLFPPRFSLRALLIATTLVAVMLGLGVWLAR